jgi:hypothetical protein
MEILNKLIFYLKVLSYSISLILFTALILVLLRSRFIQDIWSLTFRFKNLIEPLEFDYEYYINKWEEAENLLEKGEIEKSIKNALKLFEKYLDYLGYEGSDLKEKISKVPKEKLTFWNDLIEIKIPQNHKDAHEILEKIKFSFKELNLSLEKTEKI